MGTTLEPAEDSAGGRKQDSHDVGMPTHDAWLTIEKADLKGGLRLPGHQAGLLVKALVAMTATIAGAVGPTMAIHAMPADSPTGLVAAVVLGQLAVCLSAIGLICRRDRDGEARSVP
ncbi:hypothetical protein [Actinophytocola xanthii]|uniref:Uncharacterized protein n=1 Tax=Actinophytocola xanthii TaxID=1912961 RepID=A0A1Q8CRN0_9PSEU|nr:hypothetical protein [Actinophytocola xanthii]OLF17026.1 hypothetical protein BU204_13050 [Actinophytocola xanthii]